MYIVYLVYYYATTMHVFQIPHYKRRNIMLVSCELIVKKTYLYSRQI